MKPTIIRLAPGVSASVKNMSFEEAFLGEEHSEARGRGRSRRSTRKADRQEKKRTRRSDKQATRQLKRTTRIANRGERKAMKQDVRGQQQEARQVRKDTRKSRKIARKEMGDPEEQMDEQTQVENGVSEGQGENQGQGQYQGEEETQDQGQEESQDETEGQDQGNGEGESETTEDSNIEEAEQEGDDVISEDESSFSAEVNSGKTTVNPKVSECATKIEWNKELVSRLKGTRNRLALSLENEQDVARIGRTKSEIANIDSQIEQRNVRIAQLEGMLSDYSNASGRKHSARRNAEVKHAKRVANKERATVTAKAVAQKSPMAKRPLSKRGKRYGGSETPVESELNPEFSENRIEVEAEGGTGSENFTGNATGEGRGIIALDEQNFDDSPQDRVISVNSSSSFSGPTIAGKKVNTKGIIIGIGIGLLVIGAITYANKKGLFKSS